MTFLRSTYSNQARKFWLGFLFCIIIVSTLAGSPNRVRTGAEVLIEKHLKLLHGKKVGVIVNQTSLLPNGTHLIDTLLSLGVNITAIFTPEHGFRGRASAGVAIKDDIDAKTGLPIYSLYGERKRPTALTLENVDVLLFDLQDVGARCYTFYITMAAAMETVAELKKEFIILDRPNPINGISVEGPILDSSLQSGIGRFPIPVRYGLTLGELAKMIIGEKWISDADAVSLTVIPMEGWRREMWYNETGLRWTAPSPNMKTLMTATVYPGMCLFEGTNLSEGRGTFKPFEYIGAPWLNGKIVARRLNELHLPGVYFHPIYFMPRPDSATGLHPKFEKRTCQGIYTQVRDRKIFQPFHTALSMLTTIRSLHADSVQLSPASFDRLSGSRGIRQTIETEGSLEMLEGSWKEHLAEFLKLRSKYLLY